MDERKELNLDKFIYECPICHAPLRRINENTVTLNGNWWFFDDIHEWELRWNREQCKFQYRLYYTTEQKNQQINENHNKFNS